MGQARIAVDRERLAACCRRHRIRRLALFGSVLRDDFRPDGDVDVPVKLLEIFGEATSSACWRSPAMACGVRGERDHGEGAGALLGLEAPGGRPGVQHGQGHAHQDQVGPLLGGGVHAGLPVRGHQHLMAPARQQPGEQVPVQLVVLDQQQPRHPPAPPSGAPGPPAPAVQAPRDRRRPLLR
jgi:hypothetical protein